MQHFKPNTKGLRVLTPDGYQEFKGVAYMGDKAIYRIELENHPHIDCTFDHEIYVDQTKKIQAIDLKIGDSVLTKQGRRRVVSAFYTGTIKPVYDLIGVSSGARFYGNEIIVKNCEFIAFDETLIDSVFLSEMDLGTEPMKRSGQVRWYDAIQDEQIYIVALDPSLGTGGDPSAIQVFAIPGMRQIAEWQHNKTPAQGQIRILRSILEELEDQAPNSEIYYSIENNTIGETALVIIEEMGEDNIPGIFLSEPYRKGNVKRYRKGFNTTKSTKLSACAKLKRWVEEDTMKIRSKNLVRELKTFIAHGTSFAAKDGETDDLVMSTLVAVRMAMQISKYDPEAYEDLKDSFDDDEMLKPMPIGVLF